LGDRVETLTFQAGFNTNMVIAGTTLLGLAAGVIGVFALLRKRSLMTDALSHATLPGIALAFLAAGWLGLEGRSLPVLLRARRRPASSAWCASRRSCGTRGCTRTRRSASC
jgi:ABC-type Mn2+/Zn2+ transport system permease subunit